MKRDFKSIWGRLNLIIDRFVFHTVCLSDTGTDIVKAPYPDGLAKTRIVVSDAPPPLLRAVQPYQDAVGEANESMIGVAVKVQRDGVEL